MQTRSRYRASFNTLRDIAMVSRAEVINLNMPELLRVCMLRDLSFSGHGVCGVVALQSSAQLW